MFGVNTALPFYEFTLYSIVSFLDLDFILNRKRCISQDVRVFKVKVLE